MSKVYRANLQHVTGQDNPAVNIIDNTLGFEVEWMRQSVGQTMGIFAGEGIDALDPKNIFVSWNFPTNIENGTCGSFSVASVNGTAVGVLIITIDGGVPADGLFQNTSVEIRLKDATVEP